MAGIKIGLQTTDAIGFYGTTPITQRTSANQAACTLPSSYTGADTVNKTNLLADVQAVMTLANELRTSLVNLGLIKGS